MFVIVAVIVIIFLIYLYGTRNFKYWDSKGIVCEKPYPFVGNSAKQLLFKISLTDFFSQFYTKYPNERFVGLYVANNPLLIIREPRDVQRVLVSDFYSFYRRGAKVDEKDEDPFLQNLFGSEGDLWKLLRQRMTPAFTTGKLKAMFPLIVARAEKLQVLAADSAINGTEVDIKDLMARYTTDFIGACGFGIDMDALNDENSTFRKLGNRIFRVTFRDMIINLMKFIVPHTLTRKIRTISPEISVITKTLVYKIIQERNYEPSARNDFIDLLLEVKKKGTMVGESIERKNPDGTSIIVERELDDELIAAQVFIFFAAGFETSSSTSSYTMHLLAFHQEEQKKCQEEIDEVLQRHGGKLCYDAINEMKYLKMCFKVCGCFLLSEYCLENHQHHTLFLTLIYIIEKGIGVIICNNAMQTDAKYFEEPKKFNPERFSAENISKIPKYVYLPFGEGPRACIGERLGLMQALAGLAAILSKFTVVPSKNTKRDPPVEPKSGLVQTLKGGVPVLLKPRKKDN